MSGRHKKRAFPIWKHSGFLVAMDVKRSLDAARMSGAKWSKSDERGENRRSTELKIKRGNNLDISQRLVTVRLIS
jgi:hypothetical protein